MKTYRTAKLTEHQLQALSIIQDGGASGVSIESVIRETGRARTGVFATAFSLKDRGLITMKMQHQDTIVDGRVCRRSHYRLTETEN